MSTKTQKQYYVYMVRCSDNSLYTGITTDVIRRVREHNGEVVGGAKYTRVRRPVTLVYKKPFATRSEACMEEARIKTLSKEEKESMLLN